MNMVTVIDKGGQPRKVLRLILNEQICVIDVWNPPWTVSRLGRIVQSLSVSKRNNLIVDAVNVKDGTLRSTRLKRNTLMNGTSSALLYGSFILGKRQHGMTSFPL